MNNSQIVRDNTNQVKQKFSGLDIAAESGLVGNRKLDLITAKFADIDDACI